MGLDFLKNSASGPAMSLEGPKHGFPTISVNLEVIDGYAVGAGGLIGLRGRDAEGNGVVVTFFAEIADTLVAAVEQARRTAGAPEADPEGKIPVILPETFVVAPTGKEHALDGVLLMLNPGREDAICYGFPLQNVPLLSQHFAEAGRRQFASKPRLVTPK